MVERYSAVCKVYFYVKYGNFGLDLPREIVRVYHG